MMCDWLGIIGALALVIAGFALFIQTFEDSARFSLNEGTTRIVAATAMMGIGGLVDVFAVALG